MDRIRINGKVIKNYEDQEIPNLNFGDRKMTFEIKKYGNYEVHLYKIPTIFNFTIDIECQKESKDDRFLMQLYLNQEKHE